MCAILYQGGGGRGSRVGSKRNTLLKYGDIPDYYSAFGDGDKESNKNQTISVLTDYEVTALVPPKGHPYDGVNYDGGAHNKEYKQKLYKRKIYTPNRRRALVVLALSDEAIRNCQSIIDKIRKHPNVGYISLNAIGGANALPYPCRGTFTKVPKYDARTRDLVIASKQSYNDSHVNIQEITGGTTYVTDYSNLSLPTRSNDRTLNFYYGYRPGKDGEKDGEKYGEAVFGFNSMSAATRNKIIITYSF